MNNGWHGKKHNTKTKQKISISRSKDKTTEWKSNIYKDGLLITSATCHYSELRNIEIACTKCNTRHYFKAIRRNRVISKPYVCRSCSHKAIKTWNYGLTKNDHPSLQIMSEKHKLWMLNNKEYIRSQHEKTGYWSPLSARTRWEQYAIDVWNYTNQQLHLLSNYDYNLRGTASGNNFQIDHIFSIHDGFLEDIPAEIIGSIINIRFIHWRENGTKGRKSMITKDELLELYYSRIKVGDSQHDPN